MNGDLTALDMALVPSFFISYGVLGLVQLNALFAGAYLRFIAIVVASLILIGLFSWIDFSEGCATPYSALICANNADGLVGFAIPWLWASGAMLAAWAMVRTIWAIQRR